MLGMLARDKHTSVFLLFVIEGEKSFISLTPGSDVIKLFTALIYEFL